MKMNENLDISGFKEKEFTVFCGAEISRNSGLPLANELKRYILKKLPITDEDIEEIMKSNLPFEAFIETISEDTNISKILDIFKNGKPNTNHILIAKLAKNGYLRTIFTTNFDLLVERALEKEGFEKGKHFDVYCSEDQFSEVDFNNLNKISVFKIHGSVDNEESIRTTLKSVSSKTLSDKRMNVIRYLFSSGNHKKVLVFGYSCSDEFDITPQVQSIEGSKKEIIFVEHSEIEGIEDIKIKDVKNPFKKFTGMRIKCDTDNLIKKVWDFFHDIVGEYNFVRSKIEWEKNIEDWSKEEFEKRYFKKRSRVMKNLSYIIPLEKNGRLKYFITAKIFNMISNFKKAIEFYEKSIEIAKNINDKEVEYKCYGNLGTNYFKLTNFDQALKYQKKALEIANELGTLTGKAICYVGLGNVYTALKDFDKAIESYEKAAAMFKELGDRISETECYGNLGHVYFELNNFDKADEYYESSLKIAKDVGHKEEEAKCYIGLGNVNNVFAGYYKGNLKVMLSYEAINYYSKALEIVKVMGDKAAEAGCYMNIGNAFSELEDFNNAVDYYLKAENIFNETGQIYFLRENCKNLSFAYEKMGDTKNAERIKKKMEIV